MKAILKIIFVLIFAHLQYTLSANDHPPAVNTKSPDFTLKEIHYWKKKSATLSDFKGKWLVVDAWSLGCSGCVKSFPNVNEINRQLQDKATFILVGRDHKYIRSWYEKYRVAKKLELPVAYDSAFFKIFDIRTVPRIIIIDPEGMIRVITDEYVSKEKLELLFFTNKNPFSPYREPGDEYPFDESKPFLVKGNGGREDAFLHRSLLSEWTKGQGFQTEDFDGYVKWSVFRKNGIQLLGQRLVDLYRIAYIGKYVYNIWDTAYYGKIWSEPILEVKDKRLFIADYETGKNLYCYSLIIPDSLATDKYLQRRMQNDLNGYFNYTITFEERDMPVWEATKTRDLEHLRTKGGKMKAFGGYRDDPDLDEQNVPIWYLFGAIYGYNQEQPPIIDRTGVDFNIDITLHCLPDNMDAVRKELETNGIKLVKSTKKMKVLVIRDAE